MRENHAGKGRAVRMTKTKRCLIWLAVAVIPFFPPLFIALYIQGWTWVILNWEKLLTISFGLEGLVAFILADLSSVRTEQRLEEIRSAGQNAVATLASIQIAEKRLEGDIINLEDATRRNLSGFAQIFGRSLSLLQQAEREIIYANFVLGFGQAHVANSTVADAYHGLEQEHEKAFGDAVTDFWNELQTKAGSVRKIKIVTLAPEVVKSAFLEPLAERNGYNYLKESPSAMSSASSGEKSTNGQLDCVYENELQYRKSFMHTLKARQGKRVGSTGSKAVIQEEWRVGARLPVQVLIAGLPARVGQPDEVRYGCVVFLLGTESIAGIKKAGQESGFYTELQHIINMYRDLVDNVAEKFDVVYTTDTA
jgi:hypothetical protein